MRKREKKNHNEIKERSYFAFFCAKNQFEMNDKIFSQFYLWNTGGDENKFQ